MKEPRYEHLRFYNETCGDAMNATFWFMYGGALLFLSAVVYIVGKCLDAVRDTWLEKDRAKQADQSLLRARLDLAARTGGRHV